MTKTQIIETLEQLPEEFNLEDFVDRLIVIEKVKEAEEDIAQGRVYTLEQVRQFFKQRWQK